MELKTFKRAQTFEFGNTITTHELETLLNMVMQGYELRRPDDEIISLADYALDIRYYNHGKLVDVLVGNHVESALADIRKAARQSIKGLLVETMRDYEIDIVNPDSDGGNDE
jgi:hypothetical protein